MATMRDVAQQADVSVATVSHVINGTRFVDPATEERVRSAIATLGYRPNSLARSLRRGKTHTIALLVPDNMNPFFADLARAVEAASFAEGYTVILCNADLSETREATYLDVLLSKQVDGLLLIATGTDPQRLRHVLDQQLPVVILDHALGDVSTDQVLVDNECGGYLAGQALVRLGHRRIACIGGPRESLPSIDRLAGFRRALAEAGIGLPSEAIHYGDFRYDGGAAAIQDLLRTYPGFTALFAANDLMAIGAMKALRQVGLRVPDDVSIIGYDNILLGAAMSPPLTTIAKPVDELVRISISLLLKRMKQRAAPPARFVLAPMLIERESCRLLVD